MEEEKRKDQIRELEKRAEESCICPYQKDCCESKYDQCYNHSHVLCKIFERFYKK